MDKLQAAIGGDQIFFVPIGPGVSSSPGRCRQLRPSGSLLQNERRPARRST